ncbi:DCC1-like thiol-disulfide oxidoreductase family protein [Mesorhizobium zhangyense]|uniref:DCC1-like thiol-disulfide oxidoreductase family protein n=1 Tax=Mesorhizobium zhangyense TaxID=1776730 RepID=UPI0028AB63DF|nr:DCC1-like thiol-disulfide oxidoreductase family protein [Mesorhizobium zhangyense]
MQSPYGRHLAARFGIDPDDPSTFLFFDQGQPLEASDAVIATVRRLPRPWRWLTMLRFIPRPIRCGLSLDRTQSVSPARKGEACMVPPPHVRARFVDDIPLGKP